MMKIYITGKGCYDRIPGFMSQGVNILSAEFTPDYFMKSIEKRRCQVRVFLLDQSTFSAIGNAYADEILYHAGINPRKKTGDLTDREKTRLYKSIREVIQWGITEVEKAGQPVENKVRDHMKVRGRDGKSCPVCHSIIRKLSTHGFDSYYCPGCQPLPGDYFIQWK
jgi:formamidopyrimidine-DNA glycosylase